MYFLATLRCHYVSVYLLHTASWFPVSSSSPTYNQQHLRYSPWANYLLPCSKLCTGSQELSRSFLLPTFQIDMLNFIWIVFTQTSCLHGADKDWQTNTYEKDVSEIRSRSLKLIVALLSYKEVRAWGGRIGTMSDLRRILSQSVLHSSTVRYCSGQWINSNGILIGCRFFL